MGFFPLDVCSKNSSERVGNLELALFTMDPAYSKDRIEGNRGGGSTEQVGGGLFSVGCRVLKHQKYYPIIMQKPRDLYANAPRGRHVALRVSIRLNIFGLSNHIKRN